MLRAAALVVLGFLALAFAGGAALAGRRVALVIGNGAYTNAPALVNPRNDAEDMAAALKALGFEVIAGTDLDKRAMDRKILEFEKALAGAEAGVFHYSGHGLQVAGVNYLVPVDASLESAAALRIEAVRLDFIQETMEQQTKTNILFLDACRNNPLARNLARALGTRSAEVGHGLAAVESGAGTLISFSTQPGNVALDGTERNSPYSGPLVKALAVPGEDVLSMLTGVRNAVMASTGGKQVPWDNNALTAKFYFNHASAAAVPAAPLSDDAQAWSLVQNSQSEAVLEEFGRRFPDSVYAGFAKARVEELRRSKGRASWWPWGGSPQADPPKAQEQVAVVAPKTPPVPPKPVEEACEDGLLVSVAVGKKPCIKPGSGAFFKDCPDCPEMVIAPAGSFTMGSPDTEKEHQSDESPQHEVIFEKPFAVGRFAVTRDEFEAFVKDSGYSADGGCYGWRGGSWEFDSGKSWRSPGFAQTGSHPVVCVNWNDAKAYVSWLARKAGKEYRLLSEAEREYATRAGRTAPFWWGAQISVEQANYDGNYTYNGGSKGEWRQKTVPVKSFQANPWGLYQVHGNVWDWVEDCRHGDYHNAPGDGSAWTTGECTYRVLRGGSWSNDPRYLRAAFRFINGPVDRYDIWGFRVGLGWQDLNR